MKKVKSGSNGRTKSYKMAPTAKGQSQQRGKSTSPGQHVKRAGMTTPKGMGGWTKS